MCDAVEIDKEEDEIDNSANDAVDFLEFDARRQEEDKQKDEHVFIEFLQMDFFDFDVLDDAIVDVKSCDDISVDDFMEHNMNSIDDFSDAIDDDL